jgi:biopolymer transport protein ExbD
MKILRPRRRPTVSVNAMSDIAFLLLIFIMVISLLNYRQEEPIEYPEAQLTEVTQADANLEIWVRRDGTIVIDGRTVSPADAEGIIADAIAEDPSLRIHLLADRNTAYRNVAGVIEVLQTLQHRVLSLVVSDGSGGTP